MVHDDYKEMIPTHALSALDAAEERALNEHLAECAECRRDLAEWEATAASLALTAAPAEPSPEVRARILRSVSSVVPLPSRQRNLWRQLGAIAAIIIFAALLISVLVLWQQNRSLRREREVADILASPGARMKELHGTAEAPGASARIVFDWTGRAILITSGLPQPPPGKEYQLWFIETKKQPRPGKTFSTDSTGRGLLEDHVRDVDRDYSVLAVTLEPAGGVQSPTGQIYLRSDL